MSVRINGRECPLENPTSILDLLRQKAIEPLHVVVELNETIVPRENYNCTTVTDGDQIEILRFVGGG